jgi:hypothetical protein
MRFIKLTFIFSLLLIASVAIGQDEVDAIIWGEKTLEWNDFSGPTDQITSHLASTNSRLRTPISWNDDTLTITIMAEFVRSKSWVKGSPSDNLLQHERLHFDITEYHARLYRKTMASYRFKSFETVRSEVTDLFNVHFANCRAMQELYDAETNHSKNLEVQGIWNAKISKLLDSTADYKTHECKLYIGYLQ